jgi:peptidoglycan/LPS O-acetylase OafA/YrhL
MKIRPRGKRREPPLFWALACLAIACVAVAVVLLRALWSSADSNVAAWVTTFVVMGAGFIVVSALGLDKRFRRASSRTQCVVVSFSLLLAIAGGVVYLLWPGPASWYLATLPGLPAILVATFFVDDREDGAGSFDSGDGPWTAP